MLTDEGAGRGERIVLADEADSVLIPACPDEGNIAGNVNICRAKGNAGNGFVKAAKAGSFKVSFIVLSETVQTAQNHLRRFIADCTVGSGVDYAGCFFNKVKRAFGCVSVKNGFNQPVELTETHTAGRALSA